MKNASSDVEVCIMSDKRPLGIQSISRAVSILRCFHDTPELGLAEISRRTGLHRSTTAGIVNTLKAEGLLDQNEVTGKLRLGLGLFSIANQVRYGFKEICEPYLYKLLDLTCETVNLSLLDKTEVVYIWKKESSHSVYISTSIGARLPVYCTAMGKAILAFMDRRKAEELINMSDLAPLTEGTITDKKRLFGVMDNIYQEGVAYDFEEYTKGIVCVAAPLYYVKGVPIGAISISGPIVRMGGDQLSSIAKAVKDTAADICEALSFYV